MVDTGLPAKEQLEPQAQEGNQLMRIKNPLSLSLVHSSIVRPGSCTPLDIPWAQPAHILTNAQSKLLSSSLVSSQFNKPDSITIAFL